MRSDERDLFFASWSVGVPLLQDVSMNDKHKPTLMRRRVAARPPCFIVSMNDKHKPTLMRQSAGVPPSQDSRGHAACAPVIGHIAVRGRDARAPRSCRAGMRTVPAHREYLRTTMWPLSRKASHRSRFGITTHHSLLTAHLSLLSTRFSQGGTHGHHQPGTDRESA